jgi:hypothetical protein
MYSDAEVKEDVEESEEEYENAGGLSSTSFISSPQNTNVLLSGRLSGLTRPKIAPAPKRQRLLYQKTAATRVKAKGKGKGRNQGKLAQLMEMPLDVLFEARYPLLVAFTSTVDTHSIRSLLSLNLLIFYSFHASLSTSELSSHPKALGTSG